MKYFTLLLLQLCFVYSASALDLEGYIIKNTGDTVWGKLDVPEIRKGGAFSKKEIDLGAMDQVIWFMENGGKSQKIIAGDVQGFGFNNGVWNHFVVLDFSKNTWKKSIPGFSKKVREGRIFIHRFLDGAVPLYKHYEKVVSTTISGSGSTRTESTTTELYIMSNDLGYVEVAPPNFNSGKKLKEFLMKYLTMEEDFLKTVDDKAKFSDAEEVIRTYNDWKTRN